MVYIIKRLDLRYGIVTIIGAFTDDKKARTIAKQCRNESNPEIEYTIEKMPLYN